MLLKCPKCGVKNYLDPYPFWNFKGKTKCAGCDVVYAVEIANGSSVRPPQPVSGTPKDPDLLLPGFADTPDNKPVTGDGKTRPAPRGPAADWWPVARTNRKSWSARARATSRRGKSPSDRILLRLDAEALRSGADLRQARGPAGDPRPRADHPRPRTPHRRLPRRVRRRGRQGGAAPRRRHHALRDTRGHVLAERVARVLPHESLQVPRGDRPPRPRGQGALQAAGGQVRHLRGEFPGGHPR